MKKMIFLLPLLLITSCGNNNVNEVSISSSDIENVVEEKTIESSTSEIPIESSGIDDTTDDVIESEIDDDTELEVRENLDFRNAKWGDSLETVKEYEGKDAYVENNQALYNDRKVAGYNAYVMYTFDDDKLVSGGYVITDTFTNGGQYINAYENLKGAITEKYGEPTEDLIIPFVKQSQIDYSGESNALEYGYVAYSTTWNTDTTEIQLGMLSENYKIDIVLQYKDIGYEEKANTDGL